MRILIIFIRILISTKTGANSSLTPKAHKFQKRIKFFHFLTNQDLSMNALTGVKCWSINRPTFEPKTRTKFTKRKVGRKYASFERGRIILELTEYQVIE